MEWNEGMNEWLKTRVKGRSEKGNGKQTRTRERERERESRKVKQGNGSFVDNKEEPARPGGKVSLIKWKRLQN
jgi:hypothetical protein